MSASNPAVPHGSTFEMPAWKSIVGQVAAVLVALLFLAAGIFKIVAPFQVQQLFEQLLIPAQFSLPLVLTLGVFETMAGVLILMPRFRRYGGMLASLLLLAFMIYIGARYSALVGRDCSCFPWVKRAVGPAFFWEDGAMLALGLLATAFSRKPAGILTPIKVLAAMVVFSAAGFTYNTLHQSGIVVPENITVDGKPYNLHEGRVFLFFFDPQCSHCEDASRHMSTYKWKPDVTIIGLPTQQPQWAVGFFHDTKLNARVSTNTDELRKLFVFTDPPYGVSLDRGRVKGIVSHYDPPAPEAELRQLGLIE